MKQLKITTKITSRDSFSIDKYLSEISKLPMLSEEEEVETAKKIKQGDIVNAGEKVVTGKKSSCEIQIREHDAEVLIQLKQNSEFSLDLTTKNNKEVFNYL